jgi:hypothetical protein
MGEKLESCGARKKRKGLFDANEAFADIVEGMECVNVAKARVIVLSHRVDKQVESVALQGGHMTLVCTIVIPINSNGSWGQWWSSAYAEVLWLEQAGASFIYCTQVNPTSHLRNMSAFTLPPSTWNITPPRAFSKTAAKYRDVSPDK